MIFFPTGSIREAGNHVAGKLLTHELPGGVLNRRERIEHQRNTGGGEVSRAESRAWDRADVSLALPDTLPLIIAALSLVALIGAPAGPRFVVMRLPVLYDCGGIVPAESVISCAKLQLSNGRSLIACSERRLDSVALSVCKVPATSLTATVELTAPTTRSKSTSKRWDRSSCTRLAEASNPSARASTT